MVDPEKLQYMSKTYEDDLACGVQLSILYQSKPLTLTIGTHPNLATLPHLKELGLIMQI